MYESYQFISPSNYPKLFDLLSGAVLHYITYLFPNKPRLFCIYLIKDSAIEAKELDVHGFLLLAHGADVEHLTGGFRVGVVPAYHLARAREIRLGQVVEVQVLKNEVFKYLEIYRVLGECTYTVSHDDETCKEPEILIIIKKLYTQFRSDKIVSFILLLFLILRNIFANNPKVDLLIYYCTSSL